MNDLRLALRQLLKRPGFTAVAVLTLALGIGATTGMFSVLHAVVLRPLPFPDAGRLVMLWERNPELDFDREQVMPANVVEWQRQATSFESIGWMANDSPWTRNLLLESGDEPERIRARFTSSGFFEALGVAPMMGRTFRPDEDVKGPPGVAVLSHAFWQQRLGGDRDILGRTLRIPYMRGGQCTVVGVMPPNFAFPRDAAMWLSFSGHPWHTQDRFVHDLWVVGRLKPGVSLERSAQELSGIQARLAQVRPEVHHMATGVTAIPLLEQMIGPQTRGALLVLFGAVGCVLLIACANIANLLLARAVGRRKEMAIRAALGAGRRHVLRQLLAESLVLSLLGGACGLLLAWAGLQAFPSLGLEGATGVKDFRMGRFGDIGMDGVVLGFTVLATLVTSVLFGLAPAMYSTRLDLNAALNETGRSAGVSTGAERARRGLLVAELAVAMVLLVAAGLLMRSFMSRLDLDPGFRPENVLVAEIDIDIARRSYAGSSQEITRQMLERVRALPGVEAAGAVDTLPLAQSGYQMAFRHEAPSGSPPAESPVMDGRGTAPGYFQALRIPLLKGRDFTEQDDLNSVRVTILNRAAVQKFFPNEDPIGKRVYMGHPGFPLLREENLYEVVGVVGDVRDYSLGRELRPEAFLHYRQRRPNLWSGGEMKLPLLVRTTREPLGAATAVREALSGPDGSPRIVASLGALEPMLVESAGDQRLRTMLLGGFAGVALLLAAVGLYGLMAWSVAQRTQELGVRLALGAQRGDLLRLVLGQGLRLALAGIALGLAASLAVTRTLANLLFGVTPTDLLTYAAVVTFLTVTAVVACLEPALRAMRIDPMEALRHE
jgi:putative ABC transport system permease protein